MKQSIHSRCRWADKSSVAFGFSKERLRSFAILAKNFIGQFDEAIVCCMHGQCTSRFLNNTRAGSCRILIVLLRIRMASYSRLFSLLPPYPATFRSLVHPLHANASLLNIIRAGSEYEIVWNWKGNVVPFQLDVLYLSWPRHDADRVTVTRTNSGATPYFNRTSEKDAE